MVCVRRKCVLIKWHAARVFNVEIPESPFPKINQSQALVRQAKYVEKEKPTQNCNSKLKLRTKVHFAFLPVGELVVLVCLNTFALHYCCCLYWHCLINIYIHICLLSIYIHIYFVWQ